MGKMVTMPPAVTSVVAPLRARRRGLKIILGTLVLALMGSMVGCAETAAASAASSLATHSLAALSKGITAMEDKAANDVASGNAPTVLTQSQTINGPRVIGPMKFHKMSDAELNSMRVGPNLTQTGNGPIHSATGLGSFSAQ